MQKLIVLALIGLLAQLVDGALGMAYGVTSTSLLLLFGLSPAAASASVHLAEVVTTAASGLSHWRFGNIDRHVVRTLVLPGSIGAFGGAYFLASVSGETIKPFVSAFLLALGAYILLRFLVARPGFRPKRGRVPRRFLAPLGLFAGFADAVGGGGWGPITTPALMMRRDLEPRRVIGSVDTSEFAIALSATVGFALSMGFEPVHWLWVGALVLGGIIAAPIAAWLVKVMPSHVLGVLVGGVILLTNMRTLLIALEVPETAKMWVYGALWTALISAFGYTLHKHRHAAKRALATESTPG